MLYFDMAPFFGWSWDEFENTPYCRIKEWNSMLDDRLQQKGSVLSLRQVELFRSIGTALGFIKD